MFVLAEKFVTIVTRELWEQIKGSPLDTIWQGRRRMARTIKTLIINWPSFSSRVRTNIEEIKNSSELCGLLVEKILPEFQPRVAGGVTEFLTRHTFPF